MKYLLEILFLFFIFSICCAVDSSPVSQPAKVVFATLFDSGKIKNFPQAITFLKKNAVLDSYMKFSMSHFSPDEKLQIYNFLGVLAARGGYYDDSVHFYECAIEMVSLTNDALQLAVILENYSAVLIRAQQYDKATAYSSLAAELYKRMNKKLPGTLLGNIGTNAFFQGEYDKALKLHIESCKSLLEEDELITCTEEDIILLYNVAWDYCALGQTQKGFDFLVKAQKHIPKQKLFSYRSRLLYLKAMNSPIENVKTELAAEESIFSKDIASDIGIYHLLAHAEISKRENRWNDVASYLIKALNLQHPQMLKPSSSASTLPTTLQTYNARCMAIADAFTRAGNQKMAWFWVQQAGNHAEKKAIISGQITELSPILEIEERISANKHSAGEILRLEQQYETAKQELKKSNPALWQSLFSQRVNIHPDDLDQIRYALPLNAVLVETALIGDNLVFFLCEKSSPVIMKVLQLPKGEKKIKKMILRFRQLITTPDNLFTIQAKCNEFYKMLFAPIENDISRIKPQLILYSPAGILRYVPISAFYSGEKYLCERFLCCNLTGYDLLRLKEEQRNKPLENFVGFANPDGSLPASGRECDGISCLFSHGSVFRGKQATKNSFLQLTGKIDCVHVATHGVLDPSEPEKTHLIFADQPLFYTEMTAGLPLMKNLYMLTLSSCNSATTSGLNENAMEIYGMAYQFIRKTDSGATLATLWPISDEHTNHFMTFFYKSLLNGCANGVKLNRAIALNMAQREMLKQKTTMHPFYWASFILIGNFN